MNDFDDLLGGAFGKRADAAPTVRPDFGDVLAERQQRLRRRSVLGAVGVLAIGVTGMASFAMGGPTESTADAPIGSDGGFVTTTSPGFPASGETVWYCEGALDQYAGLPAPPPATTTTIAPETTIMVPTESVLVSEDAYVPQLVDSGYFRNCVMVTTGEVAPAQEDIPVPTYATDFVTTTWAGQFDTATPTTVPCTVPGCELATIHIVQAGDYVIKIADIYCVTVDDILAANGWETANELGDPGDRVFVPPSFTDPAACPTPAT